MDSVIFVIISVFYIPFFSLVGAGVKDVVSGEFAIPVLFYATIHH